MGQVDGLERVVGQAERVDGLAERVDGQVDRGADDPT